MKHDSAVVLILLLALGLRFYRLDAQSLWSDEGNSAGLAQRSLELITAAAGGDIHPPLYYYLLHFWAQLLGTSEFALRALSAFAGVLLVGLVFLIGRELFGRSVGLVAAALAAVNPFQVYYSQEARMYMLAAMLGAASMLCFIRWLKRREAGERGAVWAAATALVTAAGLYTHYAFALIPAAQTAALIIWLAQRRERRARTALLWAGILGAAFVLYLPWLPIAYRQVTTWPSARVPVTSPRAVLDALHLLLLGQTLPAEDRALLMVLVVSLILILALSLNRPEGYDRERFPVALTVTWLTLPLIVVLGAGLFQGPFLKFLLIASPPLCLLFAPGLMSLWQSDRKPMLLLVLLGIWLIGTTATSLQNLYFNPAYARDDYRGIAADIRTMQHEGDAVILNAPNQWEVFTYYYRDGIPVYPVARDRPLDEATEEKQLSDILAQHRRIFTLYWGDRESDPNRFIERWLTTHAYTAQDVWQGNVRFAIYATSPEAPAASKTPVAARFGPHIHLESYTLVRDQLHPGDVLQLTLFWTTDAPLTEPYKVFVHLVMDADESILLAQHDSEPAGGLRPTTGWTPGEVVSDNHGILIPDVAPRTTYRLVVGLYHPDGPRLPLETSEDRLFLRDIIVETAASVP